MMILVLSIALSSPPEQAPPVKEFVQAPPVSEKAAFDDYDVAAQVCAEEKKPLVVFSNVPLRQVAGLTTCKHSLQVAPVISVGIPRDGWLDRYDLPANATDEAIHAFIFSKTTQRKEVRQEAIQSRPFRVQQVTRAPSRGGRSNGSC